MAQLMAHPALLAATPSSLSADDLAALLRSFNEVTSRLQETHEVLRNEVGRLERELRDTRSQLHRARELAALGEMAAGIAHEVRNPLGSIRLYANVLVEDLTDRPAERDVAQKIVGAVSRLNAVVGDVLAFARDLRIRRERVSAQQICREAAESCAHILAETGVALDQQFAHCEDIEIDADPALIHQAMVNILRNAIEAVGEHGAGDEPGIVRLGFDRRSVLGADGRRGAMASIIVRDNGPGIPEQVMSRMFNPFFTTRETGTGLGLSIVHRIIDAHGGRVHIRNNDTGERGATVQLLLPLADDSPIPNPSPHDGDAG